MRVIVVEDSRSMVGLIKDILKRKKEISQVDVFYDGDSALKKIREEKYDFYILDYELPGVDGVTLAKEAEKKVGKERILIISAFEDFKHDRYNVLHKPFQIGELLKYLEL
ncbi:MAG TPA: response regulator [Candidatus Aciduliprofundum boonei]|uniref:Response regulator n=1 Tax=Candidatus Aciduliprofundum boonei TaxID=379547 RepID=A0A7J3T976_9ARCH|nr:response regulator [Candidatus Aciduliprofundum boonei]